MADEDEIDILGDSSLDSFLTKNDGIYDNTPLVSQNAELTELLNCEYTIHPQWLLDKPSANPACWYSSNSDLSSDQLNLEHGNEISTENTISDESGWTEKEKNLLQRGIEIFGRSNVRLSQFIGSKTPPEVKYYLRHFYNDVETTRSTFSNEFVLNNIEADEPFSINDETEVLSENDIPASIEEVIAAVSTAEPTIKMGKKKKKQKYIYPSCDEYSSFKTDLNVSAVDKISGKVKVKFKTKLKMAKRARKKVKCKKSNVKLPKCGIQIITGKGLSVPVCAGEQVIRIDKTVADSESDIEVDIEHTNDVIPVKTNNVQLSCATVERSIQIKTKENKNDDRIDLANIEKSVMDELTSLEIPTAEVILDPENVTQLEKVVHYEFFKGRNAKTPQRYLKIRNHIINEWLTSKPTYVTKTSIRGGLKNCGDVKCISQIHNYLEQIGAINFGCPQTSYSRPLIDMLQTTASISDKVKESSKTVQYSAELPMRPRCKKKFINDGEGGCTLMHDETGEVINTMVVNKEPAKQRVYKKRAIPLIYCRTFNDEYPQKYDVSLHLSALLLMDLHAHLSLTEVMGLVGGYWNASSKHLTITNFEPCRNIASTLTHCDMCPVSQAKAADAIHNKGLNILGWFHSHPVFEPEPSQQDLDTQAYLQQWIGTDKPCIGIILTPFSTHRALIASPYRCMIVDKKVNFHDQYVPFKLNVRVISSNLNIKDFLNNAQRLLEFDSNVSEENKVDFNEMYFQDRSITYLDKFISSIKMHLMKCKDVNKLTCDKLTQELKKLFHEN